MWLIQMIRGKQNNRSTKRGFLSCTGSEKTDMQLRVLTPYHSFLFVPPVLKPELNLPFGQAQALGYQELALVGDKAAPLVFLLQLRSLVHRIPLSCANSAYNFDGRGKRGGGGEKNRELERVIQSCALQ